VLAAVAAALTACGGAGGLRGDTAAHGQRLIEQIGCGTCHRIDGISMASGTVGPDLRQFSAERYVAGRLPRTPAATARFIAHPQQLQPGGLMPDLGVSAADARAIATYLFTQ
jgi:cytochrome c2